MKKALKNFSFPFTSPILIFSAVMIFLPMILFSILGSEKFIEIDRRLSRLVFLLSSLFAALGFIYCILGYHIRITRGDELKLRIHLESLNTAFSGTLVTFFILVFVFLNFYPEMLNWILVFLSIAAIIVYLIASVIIKEKYQ